MSEISQQGPHFSRRDQLSEEKMRRFLKEHSVDAPAQVLAEGHAVLALALLNRGQAAQGFEEATKAIELHPECADAHYVLSMARILPPWQSWNEAIAHAEEADHLDPNNVSFHVQLSYLLLYDPKPNSSIDNAEAALASAQAALRISPHNASAMLMRAQALDRLNRHGEARAAFIEGVRTHPETAFLQQGYGAFLLSRGETTSAQDAFQQAERLQPNSRSHCRKPLAFRFFCGLQVLQGKVSSLLRRMRMVS